MTTALVCYADGSEDLEVTAAADILARGGIQVTKAAVCPQGLQVSLAHGTKVICDKNIADCKDRYDVIVIPGGLKGAENCRDCPILLQLLQAQQQDGRYIAAICAAPGFVLAHHGFINDKVKATGYPGCAHNIKNYCAAGAVVDEAAKIITGKGPAFAMEFAFKILECLQGAEVTAQVKAGMLYSA